MHVVKASVACAGGRKGHDVVGVEIARDALQPWNEIAAGSHAITTRLTRHGLKRTHQSLCGLRLLIALRRIRIRRVGAGEWRQAWIDGIHERTRATRGADQALEVGEPSSPDAFTPWRDAPTQRREKRLFADTVAESGGRTLEVAGARDVQPALAAVLQDLRDQYVLGYYPSVSRGTDVWHDVKVEVRAPGATVRTHKGYLEP